jgi:hypothetical protein
MSGYDILPTVATGEFATSTSDAMRGEADDEPDLSYVDADQCIRLTLTKRVMVRDGLCHQCSDGSGGKYVYIPVDGWLSCKTLHDGQLLEAFIYIAPSTGVQYLALYLV